MKILLFDAASGGHHDVYIRRFVECLETTHSVTVAAPRSSCQGLKDLQVPTYRLEDRPRIATTTYARLRADAGVWRQLKEAAQSAKADLVIPLYADGLLPYLALCPHAGLRFLPLLFYPRAHYPVHFGTRLPLGSRAKGLIYDKLVGVLRRRAGCAGVLTLDEVAAGLWSNRPGAKAHWLPEPPVGPLPVPAERRTGCVIYGSLAPRKRIDLMVRAMINCTTSHPALILCGSVADDTFRLQLSEWAAQIKGAGASVEMRLWRHSEFEGLQSLASASCTAILYTDHNGMSRTLLEAAAVGTPVIVHNRGLIGSLVRRYNLGKVVDCTDAAALARAVEELCATTAGDTFRLHLAAFAARYSLPKFEEAVMASVLASTPSRGRRGRRRVQR